MEAGIRPREASMRTPLLSAVAVVSAFCALPASALGFFADDRAGAVVTLPRCASSLTALAKDRCHTGSAADADVVWALPGDRAERNWRGADGDRRMFADNGLADRDDAMHRDDGGGRLLRRDYAEREGGLHPEAVVGQWGGVFADESDAR
jgi:hypothetical protein